ncbi:MAG: ABC transporter ATP-binding protein [Lachnospiraceae bacterium]|nr:ABC transporter ATP-binding protein [Lachnospiraceae bacterium]
MLTNQNVTKRYKGKPAVYGLTIDLEPGHIYGLLGPNGSGKSTWMKMMAGLIVPDEGTIQLNGEKIGPAAKKKIVYMPTEPYFYDYMKIRDVGSYLGDFFEDFDPELWKNLLERMELEENLKVTQLSSGMTAKLKVAAALARKAEYYLLDEPLNGIDLLAREAIIETIIDCMSDQASLIISSHLVEELEKTVDQVFFLKEGQAVLTGDVDAIRERRGQSIVDVYKEIYR